MSLFPSVYGCRATAVSVARRALILSMHACRSAEKPSLDMTMPLLQPLDPPLLLPRAAPLRLPLDPPLLLPDELDALPPEELDVLASPDEPEEPPLPEEPE